MSSLSVAIEDFSDNTQRILIFIYFLTLKEGEGVALKENIEDLFGLADLHKPSNLTRDLQNLSKSRHIIHNDGGFRLHRKQQKMVEDQLQTRKETVKLKANLLDLAKKIRNPTEKSFIEEAIRCFACRPSAKRATIIMTWIACMDHLQTYLLTNKKLLKKFNDELAKAKQKISKVSTKADFSDLKEDSVLQRLREAKILDTNVHKQLRQNLEFRDSCAHPNDITITDSKVESFVEEIINNVLMKFKF